MAKIKTDSVSIATYYNMELANFEAITEELVIALENAIIAALEETQKEILQEKDTASVVLPWGTYTAKVTTFGETSNVNISFEPSEAFIEAINNDKSVTVPCNIAELDKRFVQNYINHVAYHDCHPTDALKETLFKEGALGLALTDASAAWHLKTYGTALANICREKVVADKVYELHVGIATDNSVGDTHGVYRFSNEDGKNVVKFIASKAYKQALKDDSRSEE